DRLAVRAWAEDLRLHRAGTQVDLVTEVDRDGETVWRGVSTYLAKGRTVAGAAAAEPGERDVPALPPVAGQWRLRPDVGRRYAAVSGDRNPIHTSALGAKLFGFPRAIRSEERRVGKECGCRGAARD